MTVRRPRARPSSHTPSGGDARVAAAQWSGAPAAAGQRALRSRSPQWRQRDPGRVVPATSSGTAVATSGTPAPAKSTIRRAVVAASSDVDEQSTARCSRAVATSAPAPALGCSGRCNLVEAGRRCPPTRREAGRRMNMRQVRSQPPASVASAVVIRQRAAAGDCEFVGHHRRLRFAPCRGQSGLRWRMGRGGATACRLQRSPVCQPAPGVRERWGLRAAVRLQARGHARAAYRAGHREGESAWSASFAARHERDDGFGPAAGSGALRYRHPKDFPVMIRFHAGASGRAGAPRKCGDRIRRRLHRKAVDVGAAIQITIGPVPVDLDRRAGLTDRRPTQPAAHAPRTLRRAGAASDQVCDAYDFAALEGLQLGAEPSDRRIASVIGGRPNRCGPAPVRVRVRCRRSAPP